MQHGIGGNRTKALAIADSYADACFVVAAIDLPLHGITNTTSPLYQAANERTFNVDLVNNTDGRAARRRHRSTRPGTHLINVLERA